MREEVVTAGVMGMEYPHARTGDNVHVSFILMYFATCFIKKHSECYVDLGPDHRKRYFVPAIANRTRLPPYPPRRPIREEQEYDIFTPTQLQKALDERRARAEVRHEAHAARDEAASAVAAVAAVAGAAVRFADVADDSDDDDGGDHGLRRSGRQSAPAKRYADQEEYRVTVNRKKAQYNYERKQRGQSQEEVLDSYLDQLIALEIDNEAKTIEISNLQQIVREAAEGVDERDDDIGFAMKNFTDKSLELARTNYYLQSGFKRELSVLQRKVRRKNNTIARMADEFGGGGDCAFVGKRTLRRLQTQVRMAKETIAGLAEDEDDEDDDIMLKVKQEAAKRFRIEGGGQEHWANCVLMRCKKTA